LQVRIAKDYLQRCSGDALLLHGLPLVLLADEAAEGSTPVTIVAAQLHVALTAWLEEATSRLEEHLAALEATIDKCAPTVIVKFLHCPWHRADATATLHSLINGWLHGK
jgi:hypothetical protein